jgi:hypothetical protein
VIALLAACGGGGSDTAPQTAEGGQPDTGVTTGTPTATVPAATETTATTIATPSALAKYQGTWLETCVPFGASGRSSRGTLIVGAPAANGSVSITGTDRYYTSTDCSGAAVATVTESTYSASPTGTKTIGELPVVQVDVTSAGGTPTFTGTAGLGSCSPGGPPAVTVTLGTVTLETGSLVCYTISLNTETFKTVFSSITNNTFAIGENSGSFDANGYPTTLSTSYGTYTKQ